MNLPRYTPLKRSPIRKRRSKPRPGRLKGEDLTALRIACFLRDKGRCVKCGKRLYFEARFDGDPDAYHMAHIHAKRMGGDRLENVRSLCGKDHMEEHAYGKSGVKPCPAKPQEAA